MAMSMLKLGNQGAVGHAECREQSGCAMTFVVVCHRAESARINGQAFLSAIKGLNLTLFIDARHYTGSKNDAL